jgi:hypothetical protein
MTKIRRFGLAESEPPGPIRAAKAPMTKLPIMLIARVP